MPVKIKITDISGEIPCDTRGALVSTDSLDQLSNARNVANISRTWRQSREIHFELFLIFCSKPRRKVGRVTGDFEEGDRSVA